jgi:hypothetical protein
MGAILLPLSHRLRVESRSGEGPGAWRRGRVSRLARSAPGAGTRRAIWYDARERARVKRAVLKRQGPRGRHCGPASARTLSLDRERSASRCASRQIGERLRGPGPGRRRWTSSPARPAGRALVSRCHACEAPAFCQLRLSDLSTSRAGNVVLLCTGFLLPEDHGRGPIRVAPPSHYAIARWPPIKEHAHDSRTSASISVP